MWSILLQLPGYVKDLDGTLYATIARQNSVREGEGGIEAGACAENRHGT